MVDEASRRPRRPAKSGLCHAGSLAGSERSGSTSHTAHWAGLSRREISMRALHCSPPRRPEDSKMVSRQILPSPDNGGIERTFGKDWRAAVGWLQCNLLATPGWS